MKKVLIAIMLCFLSFALFAVGSRQTTTTSGGRLPLNICFWWYQQDFPENEADAFGKFIEDKFNVDIKITIVDWGDYDVKYRLWAASNDLPDTFSGYITREAFFPEFVREGLIRTIPYNYISRFPLLKHNYDTIDIVAKMRDYYGDHYYLPRPEAEPGFRIGGNQGIFYRKDWAEKLGFTEKPRDLDALYSMLEAFVTRDPDGNGRNDTYGYAGTFDYIYEAYGAYVGRWINGPNNRIIPGWADEGPMIQALTWLRRAWTNNLLDTESLGTGDRAARFGQGIFGAVSGNVQPAGFRQFVLQQSFNNVADPLSVVDTIGSFASTRGGTQLKNFQSDTGGAVFRYNLSDELLLKYLEIWDYMLSPEAIELSLWGWKDVDYRVLPDGSKDTLLSTTLRTKYPSARLRDWASWMAELDLREGPAFEKPIRDASMAWQLEANRAAQNTIGLGKINEMGGFLMSSERSLFEASFDRGAALQAIISGTGDVATMYRAMLEDANRYGLQRAIDAQTAIMRGR